MQLGHIELFVANPLRSRDFYRDILGFEVIADQGGTFIWLKAGTQTILLRPGSGQKTASYQGATAGLVLYTDHLDLTAESLRERGLQFNGTDGSERCLTFTDPDGHWFQLVDPGDH